MIIDYAARVDIGIKDSNDDRLLVDHMMLGDGLIHGKTETPFIVAVCDGCGGYAGGNIAAETVLGQLLKREDEIRSDSGRIAEVLELCKAAVYTKKKEKPEFDGMCTTIAGCIFGEDHTVIFHAGDSRVYRFDGMYLAQMTIDHSAVQNMIETGYMTEEEAAKSSGRNIINRCIGIECLPPEIYYSRVSILPGEKYLICSDGLWDFMSSDEIRDVLSEDIEVSLMADKLTDMALHNNSSDNISVCICSCAGQTQKNETGTLVLD